MTVINYTTCMYIAVSYMLGGMFGQQPANKYCFILSDTIISANSPAK